MVRYRTIVADPPWDYGSGSIGGFTHGNVQGGRGKARSKVPYGTLSIPDICALPVSDWAADDAHLYLWTTNTHLRHAWSICESWGFGYSTLLVWCKAPMGATGFPAYPCQTEFVVFARRGSLRVEQRANSNWWQWPRGKHSSKPDAFLDIVEQVSPGPYLELFARRARFGWDYWGDESLGTAEMPEVEVA